MAFEALFIVCALVTALKKGEEHEITSSPALKSKIAGGVHGDIVTASITVYSMRRILEARPAHDAPAALVL